MKFVDSHCHLHDPDFPINQSSALELARKSGVEEMIVVGTNKASSIQAEHFAKEHSGIYYSIGVHPHNSKFGADFLGDFDFNQPRLVAIGEIGLDYHYNFSAADIQRQLLEYQIKLALKKDLPIIFHVREAFADFWPIVDRYPIKQAVLHSFSDNLENLQRALAKGWYVGVNGIVTFTNKVDQLAAYDAIPLGQLLIETDAPYLSPKPYRGQPNQSAYVIEVARALADRRQLSVETIAKATYDNAHRLFNF